MDQMTDQQQRLKKLIVYLGEEGVQNFKRDINKLVTNLNDQFILNNVYCLLTMLDINEQFYHQ